MKNFEIYKSSAGSGKTYTLVLRYLSLALREKGYFRYILAITFTNKAANEMKQRVVNGLIHLSDPLKFAQTSTVKFMLPDLVKETSLEASEITRRAGEELRFLLHDYDNFTISTIDSFVTKIIRTFAHDLYLPVDFAIETDQERILTEAIDRLLSRAGLDDEITRVLVEFTESKAEDEKDWRIENDLKEIAKELFREESYGPVKQLSNVPLEKYHELTVSIKHFTKAFEDELAGYAASALTLMKENGVQPEWLYQKNNGIAGFFSKTARKEFTLEENKYVRKTIEEDWWYSKGTAPDIQRAVDAISSRLKEQYLLIFNRLQQQGPTYFLLKMVGNVLYQVAVLGEIEKELEGVKRDKNLLFISEFNKLITDIIIREPVPFIYERIGERFRHYLIDEFQDTSELQWKNLLPLIANSLSGGNINLVVGDGKQAIYRFRNGQVDQFRVLPDLPGHFEKEVFGEAGNALNENGATTILERNFRSKPAVVNFNNRFFRFVADRMPGRIKEIYKGLEQKFNPSEDQGFVSVEWYDKQNENFINANLNRIEELVWYLTDEAGYRKQDIMILAAKNENGSRIAQHLTSKGINVISSESLLLKASPEVNLLVSAFRWLVEPGNTIHAIAVCNFLFELQKIGGERDAAFSRCAQTGIVKFLQAEGFAFSPSKLLSLTVYDQTEELIRIFGLNAGETNPYMQFFLDFVNKLAGTDTLQPADVVKAWDEKCDKLSIVVPEGADAVRIMTIHKAKGLEFPVVIYSFAASDAKYGRKKLWVKTENKELPGLPAALLTTGESLATVGYEDAFLEEREKTWLDTVNLMYVAMTRPVDRLYILTKDVEAKDEDNSVQGLINRFIASLGEGDCFRESNRCGFGSDNPIITAEKDNSKVRPITGNWISVPWQDRIRISGRAPSSWDACTAESREAWGNIVHKALAMTGSIADINQVTSGLVDQGLLGLEKEAELQQKLYSVVTHPDLKMFFGAFTGFKTEAEIILPGGNVLRPDRVITADNEIVIIDYKTGMRSPHHAGQLHEYAEALREMGYDNVKSLLVYIDDGVVVEEV